MILHFLVYPASNGYNSFFDKDEQSIGGLKNPPKVSRELYWVSLFMDALGLALALWVDIEFAIMILIYGLISKAYSHPSIRLKKFPIYGWLAAGIFQGYFTFLAVCIGLLNLEISQAFSWEFQIPAILCSALLFGSYPMTQIYQHEEDASRGDRTISLILGVLGTFHFTASAFLVASVGFIIYFLEYCSTVVTLLFQVSLLPTLIFFGLWYLRTRRDLSAANFESTMRLNLISATGLNLFFVIFPYF